MMDILIVDGPLADTVHPFRGDWGNYDNYGKPLKRTTFSIHEFVDPRGVGTDFLQSKSIEPQTVELEYFLVGHNQHHHLYSIRAPVLAFPNGPPSHLKPV